MADKICFYISTFGLGDSPPSSAAEVIFETLVAPAVRSFPEFDAVHFRTDRVHGSINEAFMEHVMTADLVIADLTELTANGFYELGMRHAAQLPTILMAQSGHPVPFDHKDFRFVVYLYDSTDDEVEQRMREALIEAIRDVLQTVPTTPGLRVPTTKLSPRETRHELVSRIHEAADALQSLRINSVGDIVASLQKIATDLDAIEDENTPSAMKEAGERVLLMSPTRWRNQPLSSLPGWCRTHS
jgi:nucleoside 2-deoxyribosyltransferase